MQDKVQASIDRVDLFIRYMRQEGDTVDLAAAPTKAPRNPDTFDLTVDLEMVNRLKRDRGERELTMNEFAARSRDEHKAVADLSSGRRLSDDEFVAALLGTEPYLSPGELRLREERRTSQDLKDYLLRQAEAR
jgi:hypothetical protein